MCNHFCVIIIGDPYSLAPQTRISYVETRARGGKERELRKKKVVIAAGRREGRQAEI